MPNRLPGLGAGAGAGSVLARCVSLCFGPSGVTPRFSALDECGILDVGTGEGLRDDGLIGTAIRDRATDRDANLDSAELVRL